MRVSYLLRVVIPVDGHYPNAAESAPCRPIYIFMSPEIVKFPEISPDGSAQHKEGF